MLLRWKKLIPLRLQFFPSFWSFWPGNFFNPLCFGVFCSFLGRVWGFCFWESICFSNMYILMNNMLKMNFTWQPRGNPGFFIFEAHHLAFILAGCILRGNCVGMPGLFRGEVLKSETSETISRISTKARGRCSWWLKSWFSWRCFKRRFAVNCRGHVLVWAKNMHFLKFRPRVKTSLDSFCLLSLGDNQPAPIQLTQMLPFNAAVLMAMEVCGISVSWNLSMEMVCGWFSYLATAFTTSDW